MSAESELWSAGLVEGRIEWMSAVANRLPMTVVAQLLGLPQDDVDMLIEKGYATTSLLDGLVTPAQLTAAGVAAMELAGYVMDHFENATGSGSSGLITDLAARYASGELDHVTAMNIMLTLFSAAGESTASLLGNAAWILVTQPDIQSQLRANSALMSAFIEETLRYEAPFRGHYRHVMRDTELGGIDLPADSRLLLMWGAANRDPEQVGAPNEFRLDRQGAQGHLTFGKGAHFCVGAALARLEAQVVLRMLIDQTSWIEAVDISSGCPAFSFAGWSDLSSPSGDLSSTVVANCASGHGARLNPTRRRAWIPVPSKPNTGKNATAISCGPDGVGDQRPPTPVDVGVLTAYAVPVAVEGHASKSIETGQNGVAHAGEPEQHASRKTFPSGTVRFRPARIVVRARGETLVISLPRMPPPLSVLDRRPGVTR